MNRSQSLPQEPAVDHLLRNIYDGWLDVIQFLQLKFVFQWRWRKANAHNYTFPGTIFRMDTVAVGKGTYGNLYVQNDTDRHLVIGNYCSIGQYVEFMVGKDHYTNHISTFPFRCRTLWQSHPEAISKGDIIVDDDVWIGDRATILSGVHVGQGAVIATGAVVTKDVPPYAIVGGVPARVIKYRFGEEMIQELLKVDYSQLNKDMIRTHLDDLYVELSDAGQLDWMPQKSR